MKKYVGTNVYATGRVAKIAKKIRAFTGEADGYLETDFVSLMAEVFKLKRGEYRLSQYREFERKVDE